MKQPEVRLINDQGQYRTFWTVRRIRTVSAVVSIGFFALLFYLLFFPEGRFHVPARGDLAFWLIVIPGSFALGHFFTRHARAVRRGMRLLHEGRIDAARKTLTDVADSSSAKPILRFSAETWLGKAALWLGEHDRALEHYRRAAERGKHATGSEGALVASIAFSEVIVMVSRGDLAEARAALTRLAAPSGDFSTMSRATAALYLAFAEDAVDVPAPEIDRWAELAAQNGWSALLALTGWVAKKRGDAETARRRILAAGPRRFEQHLAQEVPPLAAWLERELAAASPYRSP